MPWLDKKAQNDHSGLGDLIHYVIVIMLVLIAFYLGYKVVAAMLGKTNQDTMANFNSLSENIQFMIDKTSYFEHQSMVLYMKKDHLIFGFIGPDTLYAFNRYPSDYPQNCHGRPCLCIYKNVNYFPKQPLKCVAFDYSVYFHGFRPEALYYVSPQWSEGTRELIDDHLLDVPRQPRSLYSDYPDELQQDLWIYESLTISNQEAVDGIQNLYLEKFVKDNRVHILVTSGLGRDAIEERLSLLLPCPAASDPACVAKERNGYIENNYFCYYSPAEQKCVVKSNLQGCPYDVKLVDSCLCGDYFYDQATVIGNRYCYQRFDTKIFLLKFDCNGDIFQNSKDGCSAYCQAIRDDDTCDSDEQYDCLRDPCGVGLLARDSKGICSLDQKQGNIVCKLSS